MLCWAMGLFCFLWMPLFYLFWRSITGSAAAAGGVWALLAGSVVAMLQFFLGTMVEPGGFGLSRWMSACVDIVVLPALMPLLIYLFFVVFKIISGAVDFTNFALLWLIPGAAVRAINWNAQHDPVLFLVLVPVLWTAIAVGVPFFIGLILNSHRYVIIPASLAILLIPFSAASSYWAFFAQKTTLGIVALMVALTPMLVSMFWSFLQADE